MLIDTVRETIRSHSLIHKGDHIVLGLSGGPDSVCLFHVLLRLSSELSLTIHPVHVNHQLRPGDADLDQAMEEIRRWFNGSHPGYYLYPGANHSLEIPGNTWDSLSILHDVLEKVEDFCFPHN